MGRLLQLTRSAVGYCRGGPPSDDGSSWLPPDVGTPSPQSPGRPLPPTVPDPDNPFFPGNDDIQRPPVRPGLRPEDETDEGDEPTPPGGRAPGVGTPIPDPDNPGYNDGRPGSRPPAGPRMESDPEEPARGEEEGARDVPSITKPEHTNPREDSETSDKPEQPVGSLKMPNTRFWEEHGIDPHIVKEESIGRKNISHYDLGVDRDGNVWVLRKGEHQSKVIYVDTLDKVKEWFPAEDED